MGETWNYSNPIIDSIFIFQGVMDIMGNDED